MARETKQRRLVGKTTALASVTYKVALDDPQREGNMGLQGFDEETISRRHANAGLARAWVERMQPPDGGEAEAATIRVERWEADDYRDETHGLILDAEAIVESRQEGWPQQDGWHWEEPEVEYR